MAALVKFQGSRMQVFTDYNPDWVLEAHSLEGRYKKRSRMWSFRRDQYPQVAKAVNRIFGTKLPIRRKDAKY